MSNHTSQLSEAFPPRRSVHRGEWAPVYLELQPGSGEQLCIGVLAQDDSSCHLARVFDLERLRCAYGRNALAFSWAAELALAQVEEIARGGGLAAVLDWQHGIEGLILGARRIGAGVNLADVATVALRQVSLLAIPDGFLSLVPESRFPESEPQQQLLSRIRRHAASRRPELRERFGRTYRTSQSSRPLRFGYVGNVIVANFAALTAQSANGISPQVDRAKARLWDLQQLQSGVLADSLNLRPQSMSYQLLVHRPVDDKVSKQIKALREAEEELEAEADKFDIRFRPLRSPQEIANFLIEQEAA